MVKQMTPIERAKALTILGMGVSIGEVAKKLGRAKSSIHQLKEKAREIDSTRACARSPACRPQKKAMEREKQKIIAIVKEEPFTTAR